VRRPDLVARLTGADQASLALIVAPPGYGKTALLGDWCELDERPFVWLSVQALGSAGREAATAAALAALRKAGGHRRAAILVLDDAHLVASKVLAGIVSDVMRELPAGGLIALASRSEPTLPIGRLRAQRALVEIRMHDLAMGTPEAALLLRKAGLELDDEDVETLVRITEGWPAALYLAALSLHEQSDVHAAVEALSGEDHLLASYLRDEFLGGLPSDLLRFVMQTSVLDELSGPFCDAVLDEHGTGATLAQLERMSQLLMPLDGAHTRYRWHGLLRGTLNAELRRTDPEREFELHRVASAWYERRGDLDGAITHAVAADDGRRVGDLLWPHILEYATTGRNARVQTWISDLGHTQIAGYAPLALCAAHSALALGRVNEAQQWRLHAACALERDDCEPGPASLQSGLALIEALGARVDAARMATAATRAYECEPETSPWRPVSCLLKGTATHLAGDRDGAERILAEGADLGVVSEPSIASLCVAQRIVIAIERRDWELAVDLADQAEALIAQRGLEESPMSALVFAASAAARARHGRADEAKRDLRNGIDLLAVLGDFVPWYGAETRILLAHASMWLADVVGARSLLAEASRFARRMPDAVIFRHWFDEAWAYMDTLAETSLSGASSLTIAELRILRFLPSHRSFREIGSQLGVSANTVKTQAHAVYRKLGAASRSEAVARAMDAGLLGQ
jgi:LuxR family maltose regulon positive regulatory protein